MARKPYISGDISMSRQQIQAETPAANSIINSAEVYIDGVKSRIFDVSEGTASLIEMSNLELEPELDGIMEAAAKALKHGGKLRASAPCYPHSECFDNPNVKRVFTLQTLHHYAGYFRSMIIRPQGHYLSMEAIK